MAEGDERVKRCPLACAITKGRRTSVGNDDGSSRKDGHGGVANVGTLHHTRGADDGVIGKSEGDEAEESEDGKELPD